MLEFLYNLDLEQLTGIPADIYILGLAAIVVILLIIVIVNAVKTTRIRKSYKLFMEGMDGQSLENMLEKRLDQMDQMIAGQESNQKQIQIVMEHLDKTYQKTGLVKYNAFEEMGGKLSFSLALLNRKNDGIILNAMHSREGCFTYIKEVVDGNPIIMLADEEREALDLALRDE